METSILGSLLKKYPKQAWDMHNLSFNTSITMKDILENFEKEWNWGGLSQNPNITMEFIENNIDNIDFEALSSNRFHKNLQRFRGCIKKNKIISIQKWFLSRLREKKLKRINNVIAVKDLSKMIL